MDPLLNEMISTLTQARQAVEPRRDALYELIRRGRERAVFDHRTESEILAYDDDGLPT